MTVMDSCLASESGLEREIGEVIGIPASLSFPLLEGLESRFEKADECISVDVDEFGCRVYHFFTLFFN